MSTIKPDFWVRKDVQSLTAKVDAGTAPIKITPDHCAASRMLREIANDYVDLYHGSFSLIHDYQLQIQRGKDLTNGQLAAALNSLVRDYKRLPVPAAPINPPVSNVNPPVSIKPVVVNGTYTIVLNEAGEYRTLRIDDAPLKFNKPSGSQIVSYLSGADNESNYTGFAFLTGSTIGVWQKFKTDNALVKALTVLVNADSETRIDYGAAYAMSSGKCWYCNRKLTVPASLHRGIGPVCAEKLGIVTPATIKKTFTPEEKAKITTDVNELWAD